MKYEIFICHHGSVKSEIAFPLMTMFSYVCRKNFAFFDQVSLPLGEQAQPYILEAVQRSRLLLIILSQDFFKSDYTLEEISIFLQEKTTSTEQGSQRIIPIFYHLSPGQCADLTEALCYDKPAITLSSWTLAQKRHLGQRIVAVTGRERSFQYQQDTEGYFWIDTVLGIVNNTSLFKASPLLKSFQALSDVQLRKRLHSIYQAARYFHRHENKPTPEIFISFLSELKKGKRSHFSTLYPAAPPVAKPFGLDFMPILPSSPVAAYLQRLQDCVEQDIELEDEATLFLTTWQQLTEGRQFCAAPEAMQAIEEYAELLGIVLSTLKKPYEIVMQLYKPWLEHPHTGAPHAYWILTLMATAHRYYAAEEYKTAKRLYQDILVLSHTESHLLRPTLKGLMKTTYLIGDLAEATLYALYVSRLCDPTKDGLSPPSLDPIWLDILEKSVLIHLADLHEWDARPFGQLLSFDNSKSQYLLPFLKALHDSAHHLWFLSEKCTDSTIQNRLRHTAHTGYSDIIRILNNEKVSLPVVPLGSTAFHYRGVTALPEAPLPDFLAQEYELASAPWKKVQHILQTARQHIAQRFLPAAGEAPLCAESASPLVPIHHVMTTAIIEAVECLLQQGQKIWGAPPCQFAILGMGSLARQEACPFSDLEFAIVLEEVPFSYQKTEAIRYFKTWVQWAEWQLIALGETQRPVTWPSSPGTGLLSVPIPPGFRLDDGGNVPFSGKGAQCFIGSVQDLLENFTFHFTDSGHQPEVSGDTIGANALQHADRLCGSPECATAFRETLWGRLRSEYGPASDNRIVLAFHHRWATHLLYAHAQNLPFHIRIDETCSVLNVKEGLLRWPTFMLETCALYFGISELKTETRLERFVSQNLMSPAMASAFMLCIQAGLWWRHRVHLHYGYEKELIYFSQEAALTAQSEPCLRPSRPYILSPSEKQQLYMLYHLLLLPTQRLVEQNLAHFASGILLHIQPSPFMEMTPYRNAFHQAPLFAETFKQYTLFLTAQKRQIEVTHTQRFLSALSSIPSNSSFANTTQGPRFWQVRPATPSTITLLNAVIRGDLETVRQHLQRYPEDLCAAGDITDLAQRTFSYITAFQYALWACDQPLCKLLLTLLPKKDAAQQWLIFSQERTDIHQKYGLTFTLQPLLDQYRQYIDACTKRQYGESASIWCKKVGITQAALPIWLVYLFMENPPLEKTKKPVLWSEINTQKRFIMSAERNTGANTTEIWKAFRAFPLGSGAWVRGPFYARWVPEKEAGTVFGNQLPFAEHDWHIWNGLATATQQYHQTLTHRLQAPPHKGESSSCCMS